MKRPTVPYVICATHRSGSFLLCEALRATGLAGRPSEYFLPAYEAQCQARWGTRSYDDYLVRLVKETSSPNGVFGLKILYEYLHEALGRLSSLPRFRTERSSNTNLLSVVFPNVKYVWLTRRDKVRQAVSYLKAWQTGCWASNQTPVRVPEYDYHLIDSVLDKLVLQDAGWEEFFAAHAVTPLVVVYEDLVRQRRETILRVLDHLGVVHTGPIESNDSIVQKQADETSLAWVRRFTAEKSAALRFAGTAGVAFKSGDRGEQPLLPGAVAGSVATKASGP